MLESFGYAGLVLLAVYALDWSAFARMKNITDIARLSKGQPETGAAYRPFRRYRVSCAVAATAMFWLGEVVATPLHQILYVGGAIAAAIMMLITVGQPEL